MAILRFYPMYRYEKEKRENKNKKEQVEQLLQKVPLF